MKSPKPNKSRRSNVETNTAKFYQRFSLASLIERLGILELETALAVEQAPSRPLKRHLSKELEGVRASRLFYYKQLLAQSKPV